MGERVFIAPSLGWVQMMWLSEAERRGASPPSLSVDARGAVVVDGGGQVTYQGMRVFVRLPGVA